MTHTVRVHALLACYNRKDLTLSVLRELHSQRDSIARLTITLFDDGSTDGTASAVRAQFPDVDVMRGDGTAFWARSMAQAEARVLASPNIRDTDFLLWMNDDVSLHPEALSAIAEIASLNRSAVIVGAMRSPHAALTSYSGFLRSGVHPLRYTLVEPENTPTPIDAFNGNFVLVPVSVARRVGGIDGQFSHAWADIDYGYRCSAIGTPILLAPGYFGLCARNRPERYVNLRDAWKRFIGPKGGGHLRSLSRILRRHGGPAWFMFIPVTYGMWWARAIRGRFRMLNPKSTGSGQPPALDNEKENRR